MVPTCPRFSPFSGKSWIKATTESIFSSAMAPLIPIVHNRWSAEGNPRLGVRSSRCGSRRLFVSLAWEIQDIPAPVVIRFNICGLVFQSRIQQLCLQPVSIFREEPQCRREHACLVASARMRRVEAVVAKFLHIDNRPLGSLADVISNEGTSKSPLVRCGPVSHSSFRRKIHGIDRNYAGKREQTSGVQGRAPSGALCDQRGEDGRQESADLRSRFRMLDAPPTCSRSKSVTVAQKGPSQQAPRPHASARHSAAAKPTRWLPM